MNLGALLVGLAMHDDLRRLTGWSRRCLAYWPVIGILSMLIVWRAVILTLWRDGIEWRGTRYPLVELKRRRSEAFSGAKVLADCCRPNDA